MTFPFGLPGASERFDFSRLSVMVVDDNAHMRKLVHDILQAFGIGMIYEANDGADAYTLLREHYVDIVICDWMMENVHGIDLLRQVRAEGSEVVNPRLGFIMMTVHSDERRVMEAREAGVTTFLLKPFSTAALYERFLWVVENTLMQRLPLPPQSEDMP